MHHEVAQRERFRFQYTLAAPRAIRTGERRVARHAPFDADRLGTDSREHCLAGGFYDETHNPFGERSTGVGEAAGDGMRLFDSQRHHWFHSRRPARGVERRDQTGREDDDDPGRKRGHVERIHHHESGRQRRR